MRPLTGILSSFRNTQRDGAQAPAAPDKIYLGSGRVAVRTQWGAYVVVPGFNLDVAPGVVRDGVIEPWTTRLVQELVRPGQIVVNGGANFGYYTALMGTLVGAGGKVVAVEPNPHIIPYLLSTCLYAGVPDRVVVYQRALWKCSGTTLEFAFDPQYLGGGTLYAPKKKPGALFAKRLEDVIWSPANLAAITDDDGRVIPSKGMFCRYSSQTLSIDSIFESGEPVDLIQLDIEGAEAAALLGAKDVIRRSPNLRLITEWWGKRFVDDPVASAEYGALWDFLESEGFQVRHLLPQVAIDGGISVSPHLGRDFMMSAAEHGDYVWCREGHDPWA